MHKRQSYLKGVKCNTMPGEKKGKRAARRIKAEEAEVEMCLNCSLPASACKGTCVYKGEG